MGKMDKVQMMIDLNNQLLQSCSKHDYPKQLYPKNQHPPSTIPKECWASDAIVSSATNIPSAPPSESWPTQNLLFRPFWSTQDNIKEFWDPDKEKNDPDPDPAYEEKAAMKKKKKRKKNGIICAIISILIAILVMVVLTYTCYKKQNSNLDLYAVPLLTTTWAPKIPNPFSSDMDGGTAKPMMLKDDLDTLKIKYALLDNEKRTLQRDIASYLKEIQEYEILYKACKRNTSTKANISTKDILTPTCIPVNSDTVTQNETSKTNFPIPSPKPSPATTQSQSEENLNERFKTTSTASSAINSDNLSKAAQGSRNVQKDGVPTVRHSTSIPMYNPPEQTETTKSSNPKNIKQDGGTTAKGSGKSGSVWGTTTAMPFELRGNLNNKETTPTESAIPKTTKQNEETTTKRISTNTDSMETTTSSSIYPVGHTTKAPEAITIESSTHKNTNQAIEGTKSGNTMKPSITSPFDDIHITQPTEKHTTNSVEELSTVETTTPGNRNGRQDSIHNNPLFTSTQKPIPTKEKYTFKPSTPKRINEVSETTPTTKGVAIESTFEVTTSSMLESSTYASIKEMTTSKPSVTKNKESTEKGNNKKAATTTKSPAVQTKKPTDKIREVSTQGRNKLESTTKSSSDIVDNPNDDEKNPAKEKNNSDNTKELEDKNSNEGHTSTKTKPNDKNGSETNGEINGRITGTNAPKSPAPLHWFTSMPSAVTTLQSSNDLEKSVNKDEDSPTTQIPKGNNLKNDTTINNTQDEVNGVVAHKRPDNLPDSKNEISEDETKRNSAKSNPDSNVGNNQTKNTGNGKIFPNNPSDSTDENINNIPLSDKTEIRHESEYNENSDNGHSGSDNTSNDLKSTNGDLQPDNKSPFTANRTQETEIQDLRDKNDSNDVKNSKHISSTEEPKKNHENKTTDKNPQNNSARNNDLLSENNTEDNETKSNTTGNEQNNNHTENSRKLESNNHDDNMDENIAPKIGNPNRDNENVELNSTFQSNSSNTNENQPNSGTAANEQKEDNNEFSNNANKDVQNHEIKSNESSNPVKNHDTEKQSGNSQNKKPKKEIHKNKPGKHSSEESDSGEDDQNSNESKEHDKKKTNIKNDKELDKNEHPNDHKKKDDKKFSKESKNTNKTKKALGESNEDDETDENKRVKPSTHKPSNKKKDEEKKGSQPIPKFPINEPSMSTPTLMKPSFTNSTDDNERNTESTKEPSIGCGKKGKYLEFPFSSVNNSCYLNYTQQCNPKNRDSNFSNNNTCYKNTCLLMLLDTGKNPANGIMPQGTKQYTLSIAGDHDGSFAVLITMGESILLKIEIEEVGDGGGDLARVLLSSKIKMNGVKYYREEFHPVRFKSRGLFTMVIINDQNGYTIVCNNQWKLPLTFKQRLKENSLVRRIKFRGAVSSSTLTFEVLNT